MRLEIDVRLPLDRFDLEVAFAAEGPVTGIFGPSGSGKSSLLETVAGLRRGATGVVRLGERIWLDSAAGRCLPPEQRDVGFVPQQSLLFPHLDVRRNLLAGAARARRGGGSPETRLGQVCDLLELGPLLDRDVASLSGGERRRVALGQSALLGAAAAAPGRAAGLARPAVAAPSAALAAPAARRADDADAAGVARPDRDSGPVRRDDRPARRRRRRPRRAASGARRSAGVRPGRRRPSRTCCPPATCAARHRPASCAWARRAAASS